MENMNNMNNYENDNMQNWQQQEELPSYQRELSRGQYNVLIGASALRSGTNRLYMHEDALYFTADLRCESFCYYLFIICS